MQKNTSCLSYVVVSLWWFFKSFFILEVFSICLILLASCFVLWLFGAYLLTSSSTSCDSYALHSNKLDLWWMRYKAIACLVSRADQYLRTMTLMEPRRDGWSLEATVGKCPPWDLSQLDLDVGISILSPSSQCSLKMGEDGVEFIPGSRNLYSQQ